MRAPDNTTTISRQIYAQDQSRLPSFTMGQGTSFVVFDVPVIVLDIHKDPLFDTNNCNCTKSRHNVEVFDVISDME